MKRLKTGLALSGGVAKSVAHIGVLRALVEQKIDIDYLAGTSGGALVASFFAAGKSVAELEALGSGMHWQNLAGITVPRLGFLSSEKVRKFIADEIGDVEFRDLKIPVAIVASDLTAGARRVFTTGKVALACQASSAVPEFYTPVEIDGHLFIDGGLSEYVPVEALASLGDMYRIGVNLGFERGTKKKPRNLIEVTFEVTNYISQQNASISERHADFMIRPDLGAFGPFDLDRASDMMRAGYLSTMRVIPELKAALLALDADSATEDTI
ncbi:MAG: patatin-like phospholipase family protein [Candidatus Krumholzibacteriia bacterium]